MIDPIASVFCGGLTERRANGLPRWLSEAITGATPAAGAATYVGTGGGMRWREKSRVFGSERRRVLVVGAPFGDGHMRAAEAIGRLHRQRNPDLEVVVEDLCVHLFPLLRLDRALRTAYRWSTSRYRGHPHRLRYRVTGRWPGLVCGLSNLAFGLSAAASGSASSGS